MLEQCSLRVQPWTWATLTDGQAWMRPILDGTGRSLGFVRFVGDPTASWFSWLCSLQLDVYETDDASHLMTLSRAWGGLGGWDIEDAEERRVGSVYTKVIVSSEGDRLGYIDRDSCERGRILDPTGCLLVSFAKNGATDLEVAFTVQPRVNPFLRMLLLGSILAFEPKPGEKSTRIN